MTKKTLLLIVGMLIAVATTQAQWTQIGSDIDGEAAEDRFGRSVSLSNDGSIVAIGATGNDGNGSYAGHVRVYQKQGGTWTQIGSDIDGEAADDASGYSVSLSADGSIVAIGAWGNDGNGTSAGHVRVYQNQGGTWTQIGSDIDGEAAYDEFGYSVSLSDDGSVVAIGAPYNDGNGTDAGHVRVYQNQGGTWTQIGSDIDGEAADDWFGFSVSLSADGTIVAIGAILNDGNGTDAGHVRVYQNQGGTWTQIGSDIDGEAAFDQSGFSVSLSADGSVVAIGADRNDGNGTDAGHVRVYQNQGGYWSQVGSDIDGEAADDRSGFSVSLSADGSLVAIGAWGNDGNGSKAGHVRVYHKGSTLTQLGPDIDGEAAGDQSGYSVSLSENGSIVAIGAPYNQENGTYAGHVRVYQKQSGAWVQIGSDIDGEAAENASGYSVSLNSDGSVVAIGAILNSGNGTEAGRVQVYQNQAGTWIQIGSDIYGEVAGDASGYSVSLSDDGSVVAIGAPFNDGNGTSAGHVRVYQNQGGTWTQIGSDIDGEVADDQSGYSVSLSGDGTIVAIGAPHNDGNGTAAGHVRVYQNQGGTWTQIGSDIDGEAADDQSGFSVSLSDDGSVVAIGATRNDGNGTLAGHVRVYQNQGGTWTQIGSDIDSEAADDQSGGSVSLSNDGSIVAIGAIGNDGNGSNAGHVRMYQNKAGVWTKIDSDIDGEVAGDRSGYSVSLSADGTVVAIGAPYNNGNGSQAGHVLVYGVLPELYLQPSNQSDVCAGANVSFSVRAIHASAYQWQESTDGGNTFTNISNGGVYAGATTDILNISGLTAGMNNYQYRCIPSNAAGNTISETATLTLESTAPTITSTHNDQTVDANASCQAILPDYTGTVTATDNCSASFDVTQSPVAGTAISGTSNTVTLTVTDGAGNSDEVSFNVEVVDNSVPVITSTHDAQSIDSNENCEASLPDYTTIVTASDNCSDFANMTVTQSIAAGTVISGATNSVTLKVTDEAGNFAEISFNVEVVDNTNPTITSTHSDQQLDADAGCEASLPDYTSDVTATDNCDADLAVTQSPTAGTTISGISNTVTLTATDDAGNFAEISFNVEVVDNINPTITSTHNDRQVDAGANCEASLPDYTSDITATDNCDATLNVTQNPAAGTTISGATNEITLTVTDDAGNLAEVSFNVELVDNTNPTITCPGNQTIDLNEGESFYTVQADEFDPTEANDNCGIAEVLNDFNSSSTLKNEELTAGTHTINWTVTDNAGNTAECSFDVTVNAYVGISEIANGYEIYPNPTSGIISVNFAKVSNIGKVSIEVTDITGRIIQQFNNLTGQQFPIDISDNPNGIYFIKIQTSNNIYLSKILKN